ncbi:MAG: hypothetical protein PHG85_01205 [Candidatus Altiarchaeota archaeon]|nr:hypothetical protein [Candidatus Altiarchaeota archaeon]
MAEPERLDQIAGDFEGKVNTLKGLFAEEEKFWAEIKYLKAERNKLNLAVSDLSNNGKRLRSERDKLNEKVASLKQKRSEIIENIKLLRSQIKDTSVEKKSLTKDAGSASGKIMFKLNKILNQLLGEDITLDREQKLFEDAISLSQKLDIAAKVDELHSSILSNYTEIAAREGEINALSDTIRSIAKEAEEKHIESIKVYAELDEIRKQSDELHKKLLDKYEELRPIRDNITALKDEIKLTEDKMDTAYTNMAKAREVSASKKRAERISEAKEKFKTGKRISFDDFKTIISSEDVLSQP